MKKIVIVTDAWHPQVNGVVRTLTKCRDLMIERGYDVTVISPLDYRSVPCPTYPEIRLALTTPGALRRRLKVMRPDYVHIATEGPLGFMARRACLKMGWSFTTSFHTRFPEYLAERFPVPPQWTYAFLRRFHNAAQHTLVPTQSIVDDLKGRGFTLDLPGTKLIVGDGPSLNDLRARSPEVVFVGKQEGETLANTYAAADVFVFPSRTDTYVWSRLAGSDCLRLAGGGLSRSRITGCRGGNRGRRSLRRSWEGVSVSPANGAV
jgi:glycosyltransferase involved in cell wall biosynthesis